MIKKLMLLLFVLLGTHVVTAQEHKWALGFYGDVQLESPGYDGSFGIQGKYDFSTYQGIQALVNGRKDFVSAGADYVVNFLDKKTHRVNIFAGIGASQDFYRREVISTGGQTDIYHERFEQFTMLNAQCGVSYYVPDVALSVFAGYKLKTDIEFSGIDPNFVMIGLRYHLW